MVERGFAFEWDSGGQGEHTWIILTDIFDTNKVIVANISSYKPLPHDPTMERLKNDPTCLLNVSAQYSIYWQVKSFVFYRHARIETVEKINNITSDQSHFKHKWPLSIVDMASSGLALSQFTPPMVKRAYQSL